MAKTCPPGVICIENVTIVMIILTISVCMYMTRHWYKQYYHTKPKSVHIYAPTNSPMSDVYDDPHHPPERPTSLSLTHGAVTHVPIKGVPINIPTQGHVNVQYQQLGVLTRQSGDNAMLPLFGKQLVSGRDKWQYYTMSDNHNSVKLPVTIKGKSCTGEYGCDGIYSGDSVYVEGYNDIFKVLIYDSNPKFSYLPL